MAKLIVVLLCTVLSFNLLPELTASLVSPIIKRATLKIKYPNGIEVKGGNELTPGNVTDAPAVDWVPEADTLYTLTLTDPDALPNTPFQFVHWFIGNIPGNSIAQGQVITSYLGSNPPAGTGLHRYIFSLYRQPGTVDYDEEKTRYTNVEDRKQFPLSFATKFNLALAAGNYFEAQHDGSIHSPLK